MVFAQDPPQKSCSSDRRSVPGLLGKESLKKTNGKHGYKKIGRTARWELERWEKSLFFSLIQLRHSPLISKGKIKTLSIPPPFSLKLAVFGVLHLFVHLFFIMTWYLFSNLYLILILGLRKSLKYLRTQLFLLIIVSVKCWTIFLVKEFMMWSRIPWIMHSAQNFEQLEQPAWSEHNSPEAKLLTSKNRSCDLLVLKITQLNKSLALMQPFPYISQSTTKQWCCSSSSL